MGEQRGLFPEIERTVFFSEAMEEVIKGKRVTRISWGDKNIYLLLREGQLQIKNTTGYHPLIVSEGDMLADDWITVGRNGD